MDRLDVFKNEILAAIATINERFDGIDRRFDGIDKRFDNMEARMDAGFMRVNEELVRLELTMGEMEHDMFALSEGQDMMREVLETRVAHIEEILEVREGV